MAITMADPGVHDGDPRDHEADPGEHDRPILVFTVDRSWRSRSAEIRILALTALLHRAYGALAVRGMRFFASHQSPEDTADRLSRGHALVAEDDDGRLVGTITVYEPAATDGCAWYDRPEVGHFGQFAVEPSLQGTGLGNRLLDAAEAVAVELGIEELACDTAEPATHLIAWYERRGYARVGWADWRPTTNYRSVILSRRLGEPPRERERPTAPRT